jgi:hypothetical protein
MKKSLFIALFLAIAILAGSVPVITNAQAYYGNYSTYGSAYGCLTLTAYQQLGTTDSQTNGQVTLLQEFLNQTGYLSGVSGTFDTGTLGAIINYQNAHGILATGVLDPITISAINAQSCENGYGSNYGGSAPIYSYPITQYGNGTNCYWSGGYNSTYVCRTSGAPIIYPVNPGDPMICNTNVYGNGYYNNGSWNNGCNGYNSIRLNSLSASYSYNTATITVTGYGFTSSGNTVHFGNSIISNVYSPNGTTLVFSVPTGYAVGTYSITVSNAQGGLSNALSFAISGNSYYGNNWNGSAYNNYGNNCDTNYYVPVYNNYSNKYDCNSNAAPILSAITGPSNVVTGTTNTWDVSLENSSTAYASLTMNWGDGDSSIPSSSNSGYNGIYSFSHEYITPGVYTMRLTSTSANGVTTYQTYTVTVTGYGNNGYYAY